MWKESEIVQKILQGYLLSWCLHPAGLVNSLRFRFCILRDKWIWSSAWLKLLRQRAGTPTHCCWFRKPFSQRQSRRAHLPQQPGGMAMHTYAQLHTCARQRATAWATASVGGRGRGALVGAGQEHPGKVGCLDYWFFTILFGNPVSPNLCMFLLQLLSIL